MKRYIQHGLFLLLFGVLKASAQSYDVPQDYHFKTTEDFAKYEPDVIKTADWMQQTPWTSQPQKREEATQFFLHWIKGTPAVTIKLTEALMNLSDRNPQLGFTYMAQFSKYALQHKDSFDLTQATMEALHGLMIKYQAEPTRKSDKDVEALIKLEKNGALLTWVTNGFYRENE